MKHHTSSTRVVHYTKLQTLTYPVAEGRPAKFVLLHLLPPDLDGALVDLSPLHLRWHPDRPHLQTAHFKSERRTNVQLAASSQLQGLVLCSSDFPQTDRTSVQTINGVKTKM